MPNLLEWNVCPPLGRQTRPLNQRHFGIETNGQCLCGSEPRCSGDLRFVNKCKQIEYAKIENCSFKASFFCVQRECQSFSQRDASVHQQMLGYSVLVGHSLPFSSGFLSTAFNSFLGLRQKALISSYSAAPSQQTTQKTTKNR